MEPTSNPTRKEKISVLLDRISGCLWGMCIADAISLPSHFYPNSTSIKNDYGIINKYIAPKEYHPLQVLILHYKDGILIPYNGIIGKSILHNKQKYWGTEPPRHPHIDLKAGENILDVELARLLLRTLVQRRSFASTFDQETYRKSLLDFLTKPASHNDAYASVALRKFVYSYEKKRPLDSKIREDEHCATLSDLIPTIPAILSPIIDLIKSAKATAESDEIEITQDTIDQGIKNADLVVGIIHENSTLSKHAQLFAWVLLQIVTGSSPNDILAPDSVREIGFDFRSLVGLEVDEVIGDKLGISSAVDQGLSVVLYLFGKFQRSFQEGIITNANLGGDTCGRGALLGALFGALNGKLSEEDYWMKNLYRKVQIGREIAALIGTAMGTELPQGSEKLKRVQVRPLLPKKVPVSALLYRIEGMIWGLLCADALAMPVHFYYDLEKLKEDYGEVTGYVDPKEKHHMDMLYITETSKEIVGKVIGKDTEQHWGVKNNHVHVSLKAGENTLDANLFRTAIRLVNRRKYYLDESYDPESYLRDYVDFMTKGGKNKDTYIADFHREFFKNYNQQKPIFECGAQSNQNNDISAGFFTVPAIVFSTLLDELKSKQFSRVSDFEFTSELIQKAIQRVLRHLSFLHRSERMRRYAQIYTETVIAVLLGLDLRKAIEQIVTPQLDIDFKGIYEKGIDDEEVFAKVFKNDGFIENSMPAGLYLAYKYANEYLLGAKANANLGGDNVGRAVFVGVLVGAQRAQNMRKEELVQGLVERDSIAKEIHELISY